MKNTIQQLLKLKWTGPIDKSGKFHLAQMGQWKEATKLEKVVCCKFYIALYISIN